MTPKTPLQELILMIDNGIHNKGELIKTFGDTGSEIGNGIKYLQQVKEIILDHLLEKEKQFAQQCFEAGEIKGWQDKGKTKDETYEIDAPDFETFYNSLTNPDKK